MSDLVSYRLEDGVATIVMDDGKANALSIAMLASINAALDRAMADGAVVVLTGREGIFSGGFDLKVMGAGGTDAALMIEEGLLLALRLLEYPAPVVVACNGHAVAMGVFLLLSGDYRIGTDGPYRIVANEVAIGMTMPRAAIEISRQRLTPSHFNRAMNLAEVFSPTEAVLGGFLDKVVDGADLMETAASEAARLGQLHRSAHKLTKQLVRTAAIASINEGLESDREIFKRLRAMGPAAE